MSSLLPLFCQVDDFCQQNLPRLQNQALPTGKRTRRRACGLCESEVITILIHFHLCRFRDFKTYYLVQVQQGWKAEFPRQVSYQRFIQLLPRVLVLLEAYLASRMAPCSGLSIIDSTPLPVCENPRIHQHKVFKDRAQRGKSTIGWFYGFKLHLVINDEGELLNLALTAGNVDDRRPAEDLLEKLFGTVLADKGYISQPLFEQLRLQGVRLLTRNRKGMKPSLMRAADRRLLRKRALIETVVGQLKNLCHIQHTRHRAPAGFLSNLLAGLIAYCHLPNKPSLHLRDIAQTSLA